MRALPGSDSHSEDEERPAVCLVALCGDERDVAAFETERIRAQLEKFVFTQFLIN